MTLGTGSRASLAGLLLFAAAGCATTGEYARFARSGSAYATALDHLLVAAATTAVDATSERLLQDDALANRDLASYDTLTAIDEERLATIGRLRTHARLLALYFSLLSDLATANAPDPMGSAVAGVVDSLDRLGQRLRGSPLVRHPVTAGEVTRLAAKTAMKAALRRELELRKETIRLELVTQEVLLARLAESIAHDLAIVRAAKEQRLVIHPLTDKAPISRPDTWATERRKLLLSQGTLDELARGSDAGAQLRKAFEDLIAGRASLARLDALLASVDGLLAVAASLDR